MPGNLMFGIDYGKGPQNVPREIQADLMVEAHCTCTREGIDLFNVWTGANPNQYNWAFQNPDSGNKTYDQVVDISLARGIEVYGQIATTPWWALTLWDSGTASAGSSNTLTDNTKNWGTGSPSQWGHDEYDIRIVAGTGAGQTRAIKENTATVITLDGSWQTMPDTTSQYEIKGRPHKWPPDIQYAQAFKDACQEVASRFSSRITWWEFWNEEDATVGWHGTNPDPVEYRTWLIRCSQGVKMGNSAAKVAVGGLLVYNDNYMNQVRAAGGQAAYDGIALHPYPSPDNNSWLDTEDLQKLRANMNANGSDGAKPILVNEYGSWDIPPLDEATQAARVEEALNLLRFGNWNVLMAAYNTITDIQNNPFGLCTNGTAPNYNDPVRRQAFYKFRDMTLLPYHQFKAPVITNV